jgi:capsular exopolysaccharide synthesis family protein
MKDFFLKLKNFLIEYRQRLIEEVGSTTYIVRQEKSPEGIDGRAVTYLDPKSHISEQFRIVRTNIRALSPDNPLSSFVITSAIRGEGKTITSCNIALAFAQDLDKRVILLDADLRKASVHKILGINRTPGLSDMLSKGLGLESLLQKPAIGKLYVIPAGEPVPNPSELLSSLRMHTIIKELKARFDYIFFDCAPIIPVTDAGVLGSQVDGSILVVRAASTGALDVERAFSLLKEAKATPVGAILANVISYVPYYLYRYRYIYVNKY